jgi:hypothetical protein
MDMHVFRHVNIVHFHHSKACLDQSSEPLASKVLCGHGLSVAIDVLGFSLPAGFNY